MILISYPKTKQWTLLEEGVNGGSWDKASENKDVEDTIMLVCGAKSAYGE